jgi:hypothetical protein
MLVAEFTAWVNAAGGRYGDVLRLVLFGLLQGHNRVRRTGG